MLDKLKISRGWTIPDDGSPDAEVFTSFRSSDPHDRPVIILWAEDWERIKAVVEAELAIAAATDATAKNTTFADMSHLGFVRDHAVRDLRAHIEKGGA